MNHRLSLAATAFALSIRLRADELALMQRLGASRARVAVFLEKRVEAVVASFAVPAAGGVLVPVNPLLKAAQVAHILQDAGAEVLVTSVARLAALLPVLADGPALRHVVAVAGDE